MFKSLVRSDHLSVMVSANQPARPERRYVSFRVVRKHRKLALQHKLEAFDCHWKLANVTPNPRKSPLTNCNQLRPMSLTNIIIRLFEKLILKFALFHILKSLIGPDQFAYKENSNTTMALVMSQHCWLKCMVGWKRRLCTGIVI